MEKISFADTAIVSCGTLSLELKHLQNEGRIDPAQILYTTPGLHQDIAELETQLGERIEGALETVEKVVVVYGGKFCYVNADEPTRQMQHVVAAHGPRVARIDATHCMDMLADEATRTQIAAEVASGEPVWWMTPGWVQFRKAVFKGWDKGLANENFPRHTGGAIVLDGIGFMDSYMAEKPEAFLEYCDWMGIPMTPYPVSLDRFVALLEAAAGKLQ